MLSGRLRLATVDGEAKQFVATTSAGHSLVIDTAEGGTGVRPVEMALLAAGACTAIDIISILRKQRQPVTSYEVELSAEQRAEYPQTFSRLTVKHKLRGPIDPAAVERAISLSETKYCSVGAMIAQSAKIETRFEILPAAPES